MRKSDLASKMMAHGFPRIVVFMLFVAKEVLLKIAPTLMVIGFFTTAIWFYLVASALLTLHPEHARVVINSFGVFNLWSIMWILIFILWVMYEISKSTVNWLREIDSKIPRREHKK